MCIACILHDGLDILEVEVDDARDLDEVGNALYALTENVIGDAECVCKRNALLADELQSFVRDDNEGIDVLAQLCNALFCLIHTALAFKSERLCDDADGEGTHILCNLCNDRCCTCAGAAAHTGGDEDHVCALEGSCDQLAALLGSLCANLRLGACASALCILFTDLHAGLGLRAGQCLTVCIHADELDVLHAGICHAVYGVSAAAAYTNDLNGLGGLFKHVINFKRHFMFLLDLVFNR